MIEPVPHANIQIHLTFLPLPLSLFEFPDWSRLGYRTESTAVGMVAPSSPLPQSSFVFLAVVFTA